MMFKKYKELNEQYHHNKITEEDIEGELEQSSKKDLIELLMCINSSPLNNI